MALTEREQQVAARPLPSGGLLQVPSLYGVAAFAVLGAIFVLALAPRFDADFWWHLKVGQYISTHHSVPSHDFMSYTFAGHAWIDHEWLPELVIYGLYRLIGLQGPLVFFALVIGATFTLVYVNMVQREISRLLALGLSIVAAVASSGSWGPRIQMLSLLFLAIYALVLHRFVVTRDRRLLAIFPAIMLLWANSHGGFVIGLVLLAITLVGELLNRRTNRPGALAPEDLRALGITSAITLAVTILNPNGVRQLLYPLTFILPNPFTNLIEESASPDFHLVIMTAFEALLLLTVAAFYLRRRTLSWTHLLLVLAFTHLALSQMRNVPVWCVLVTPLVALYTQEMFGWTYREKRLAGGIKTVINLAFVALLLVAYVRGISYLLGDKTVREFETRKYPAGAISYLQAHSLPRHVFVSYVWGGYLLWHLFPRYQVYMDSRADTLYTATILTGYEDMYNAAPAWESDLNRYHVDAVLIERTAPLAQVLAKDGSWQLRYRDRRAVIYARR